MRLFKKETWKGLLSEEFMVDSVNVQLGGDGDIPVIGVTKVTAPAGSYFYGVTCWADGTKIATLATAGSVNYTADSYLTKVLAVGQWHPFMAQVTEITLTASTDNVQAFLRKV